MAGGSGQSGGSLGRALNPGLLSGITFSHWCSLLWDNRFRVHPRYGLRALSITAASLANSMASFIEERRFSREWESAESGPPVFVIGLARSGTTHMHNLLCTNPALAYPSMIEAHFPRSFITLGRVAGGMADSLLGGPRAQDNVAFGAGMPAEEESALMALRAPSGLFSTAFPHGKSRYVRFRLSSGYNEEEAQSWIEAIRWFYRKLAWRHQKPLVFKNPAHTGKLDLLMRAFPDARIIFVHRHPYEVLRSRRHAFGPVSSHRRLQVAPLPTGEQDIERCTGAMNSYLENRQRVPDGQLLEVSYDDIATDPLDTVGRIYATLGLPGFEDARPALEAYLAGLGRYQKNRHAQLPESTRDLVRRECPEWFNEWGYCH